MKKYAFPLSLVCCLVLLSGTAIATTVDEQLKNVASQVADLELGFDHYILGSRLDDSQKQKADSGKIKKATRGTYKFKDGELFVVAARSDDTILGLYKEYTAADSATIKSVIGDLMLNHGEPTAMAHNKLVYWTYNSTGKISQDDFDFSRQSGGTDSLVTVKLSSSEPIVLQQTDNEEEKEIRSDMYVMITSDPLSRLFLAKHPTTEEAKK